MFLLLPNRGWKFGYAPGTLNSPRSRKQNMQNEYLGKESYEPDPKKD